MRKTVKSGKISLAAAAVAVTMMVAGCGAPDGMGTPPGGQGGTPPAKPGN